MIGPFVSPLDQPLAAPGKNCRANPGPNPFPFEPSHSLTMAPRVMPDYHECVPGLPLVYFKTLQTLFGTGAHASGVVDEHARAKIENRQLWGLLWGPLIHLGASSHISNQLATTTEPDEPERAAGFLPSVQQVSFFARNGLRNQRSVSTPQSGMPPRMALPTILDVPQLILCD